MLALLELNLFPGFAMDGPWLADLASEGENIKPPPRLCWIAEDAILLAPYRADQQSYGGFLIVCASALGKEKEFVDEKGNTVVLSIPKSAIDKGSFCGARGNAILPIIQREN